MPSSGTPDSGYSVQIGEGLRTPPAPPKTLLTEDEPLDQETLDRIESLLQKIGDQEVQKSLREVLIKGAKLERYRSKSPLE